MQLWLWQHLEAGGSAHDTQQLGAPAKRALPKPPRGRKKWQKQLDPNVHTLRPKLPQPSPARISIVVKKFLQPTSFSGSFSAHSLFFQCTSYNANTRNGLQYWS